MKTTEDYLKELLEIKDKQIQILANNKVGNSEYANKANNERCNLIIGIRSIIQQAKGGKNDWSMIKGAEEIISALENLELAFNWHLLEKRLDEKVDYYNFDGVKPKE